MNFSLSQAAKETGRSKTTIARYIKNGKMSCVSQDKNGYQIDPSELFRVFPPSPSTKGNSVRGETPDVTALLQQKIEFLEKLLEQKEKIIEGLETDKAFLQAQLKSTTLLLEDRRLKSPHKPTEGDKKSFWWRRTRD